MRKIITLTFILAILSCAAIAQTPVFCDDFTNYDSATASPTYNGWALTYSGQFSYYTSQQSSGVAPNSYKFGVDSATAITPDITGADNISFWMKGNASTGGTLANGAFYIYESPDSANFTQIDVITPIAAFVEEYRHYPLSPGTRFVKFFYDKDSGNVAFDDFCATIGPLNVGVKEIANTNIISAYPNPVKGIVNLNINSAYLNNAAVSLHNVLGKEVKRVSVNAMQSRLQIDLSDLPNGVYYIHLKSDAGEKSERIILKK